MVVTCFWTDFIGSIEICSDTTEVVAEGFMYEVLDDSSFPEFQVAVINTSHSFYDSEEFTFTDEDYNMLFIFDRDFTDSPAVGLGTLLSVTVVDGKYHHVYQRTAFDTETFSSIALLTLFGSPRVEVYVSGIKSPKSLLYTFSPLLVFVGSWF